MQSRLFSGPPRHNWTHVFATNGLCSGHDAPDFPSVSWCKKVDKSMLALHQTRDKVFYFISVLSCALPLDCLDGCVLKQHTLRAAFGQDHVHWPWKFYCASGAMCSVPSPWGPPWLCLQLGRAGHTGSVENNQCDSWGEDVYSETIPPLPVYYDQEKCDGMNSGLLHAVTFYHSNLLKVCWNWCTNCIVPTKENISSCSFIWLHFSVFTIKKQNIILIEM